MKKLISRLLIIAVLLLICFIGYVYNMKPSWLSFIPWPKTPALSTEEISSKQKACDDRFTEAQKITNTIRERGQRVTEPKIFYSPTTNSCIISYFVQDMKLEENTTYNTFIIYDLDRSKRLYENGADAITNYPSYLEKIKSLGGK
ncbi:MAG: hypothetical protein NTY12_02685 [Candidatus Falkowbacteria bacterium]|nr:hypothetical protein [Candidatus Falkowbacteria bacterium]